MSMATLDQIRLSEQDRSAIREAARLLVDAFGARRVVLFGSKARGDDTADSDIDLLVLTDHRPTWNQRLAMRTALQTVQSAHNVLISLVLVPEDQWHHGPYQALPIWAEIDRDGVVV